MPDLQSILNNFSRYLYAQRGFGNVTVTNHISAIRRLVPIVGASPTQQTIEEHIAAMMKAGASYSHIVNTSVALEHYCEFLGTPIKLGRPRKPKRLIHGTLSEAEIAIMLASCRNLRNRAILSLLAYSGLRNKELCELQIQDVDLSNQLITVRSGKGKKDRNASISGTCVAVLTDYLRLRNGQPHELLFVTVRKKEAYQPQVLRKLVRKTAELVGIHKRVGRIYSGIL